MSGGHFKTRRKYFFLRKIQDGSKVSFEKKVTHLTSTTSKDPLLIAKSHGPKVDSLPHPSDRIVKTIQIQTGAGQLQETDEEKLIQDSGEDLDKAGTGN